MTTINQVREKSTEEIMINLRKVAANLSAATFTEIEEAAMCYTVLMQRDGKDPKVKLKSMGFGIFETAENEGWF
jgi:hypothetical protein